MLLSERATRDYIITLHHFDIERKKVTLIRNHIINAASLPEAIILSEPFLQPLDKNTTVIEIAAVRLAHTFPAQFMNADETTIVNELKTLANDDNVARTIDDLAQTYLGPNNDYEFIDTVKQVFDDVFSRIPEFHNLSYSITNYDYDFDYIMIERCAKELAQLYLATGTRIHRLPHDYLLDGPEGFASLLCGIRDKLSELI